MVSPDDINDIRGLALCRACGRLLASCELTRSGSATDILSRPDPPGCTRREATSFQSARVSLRDRSALVHMTTIALVWNSIALVAAMFAYGFLHAQAFGPLPAWYPISMAAGSSPIAALVGAILGSILATVLVLVGFLFIAVSLLCLAGREEIRIRGTEGSVRLSLGPIGLSKRFRADQVRTVTIALADRPDEPEKARRIIRIRADRELMLAEDVPDVRLEWLWVMARHWLLHHGETADETRTASGPGDVSDALVLRSGSTTAICPQCDSPITVGAARATENAVQCRECGHRVGLRALLDLADAADVVSGVPPKGCTIEDRPGCTVVCAPLGSRTGVIGGIFGAIVWNVGLICFLVIPIPSLLLRYAGSIPTWFPTYPAIRNNPVPFGDAILWCLLLIPFILVGAIMILFLFQSLYGRLEIELRPHLGTIRQGGRRLRYTQRFNPERVRRVGVVTLPAVDSESTPTDVIEIEAERTIQFGHGVKGERQRWVAAALRALLLEHHGSA